MKRKSALILAAVFIVLSIFYIFLEKEPEHTVHQSVTQLPSYSGNPYVIINNNEPEFTQEQKENFEGELYSELDALGRCGYAMARLGQELMPTEGRTSISHIKPSGWRTAEYDFIEGKYLYNRSHLIGFQLAGENANVGNLITGTRYLNIQGMLAFENLVADYIRETNNHVLYRVTPYFQNDNLLASGIQIEALSLEDQGEGVCFNIYAYNVQPGVKIDYATGDNCVDEEYFSGNKQTFILNTNSKRFHTADCNDAKSIKNSNRQEVEASRELMIAQGYEPCNACSP